MNITPRNVYDLVTTPNIGGNNWGCGVVIHDTTTNKILLGYRTDTKNWATPGGKIERGETPLNGVMRECLEESGLILGSVQCIGYYDHKDNRGRNWSSFIFYSNDYQGEIKSQPEEIGDWMWVDTGRALQWGLFEPSNTAILMSMSLGALQAPDWDQAQPEIMTVNTEYNGDVSLITTGEIPTFGVKELPAVSGLYKHGRWYDHCAYSYDQTLLPWD